MGDSRATLNGRENVCIIGLAAPTGRLQSIRMTLSQSEEFLSVSAASPLVLENVFGKEPLVVDGIYTLNGGGLRSWAKAAYDSTGEVSAAQPAPCSLPPQQQPPPLSSPPPQQPKRPQQQPPVQICSPGASRTETLKRRHGCLTAWLFLVIAANAVTGILLLFMGNGMRDVSDSDIAIQSLISTVAVACGILLLRWKKIGFFLLLANYVMSVTVNLSNGDGTYSFFGIIGITVLWVLLNIKANGISAWEQMSRNRQF